MDKVVNRMIISCLIVFLFNISCKKEKSCEDCMSTPEPPAVEKKVDIYVTGGRAKPTYWKNGQEVLLDGGESLWRASIAVSGNDVYVAGELLGFGPYEESAWYWKNNQAVQLVEFGSANSIYVIGNDVYVTGYEYIKNNNGMWPTLAATYWKNGQAVRLSDVSTNANATDIVVVDSDVFVAGVEGGVAKYWKNGQPVSLPNGTYASSIAISGSDIYVAGGNGTIAKYWKNGQEVILSRGSVPERTSSISVTGSGVYVAGWETVTDKEVAKYWKNGQALPLTNAGTRSLAYDMTVVDNDIYISGELGLRDRAEAVYWKNGELVKLSNGAWATGIAVVKR